MPMLFIQTGPLYRWISSLEGTLT